MDLRAAEDVEMRVGEIRAISTGISVEIPPGFMGEVRSRSGMALKGLVCNNAPGTIDPSYRGEVKAIMRFQGAQPLDPSLSGEICTIRKGDRIAQLIVVPYLGVEWVQAEELAASARGEGGMGSTGVR
jgi:dUTP pyrophosphatase